VPFALSSDQLIRLGQNGVVISPGIEKEFFTVYEKARYDNVPISSSTRCCGRPSARHLSRY
jgi:hypothetical protein